jgi:hypothetical protein
VEFKCRRDHVTAYKKGRCASGTAVLTDVDNGTDTLATFLRLGGVKPDNDPPVDGRTIVRCRTQVANSCRAKPL